MPIPATKVLIVEDEGLVALDMRDTLRALGYEVLPIASSASEALSIASEGCPDLVLMDIRIKGSRDGVTTASLLQERFHVPVVFLTAHADTATLDRARRAAPFGYLIKPVTAAALASAIEVATFKHKLDRELRASERWLSTTLRALGDAVVAVDLKGLITYLNPVAERLLGVTAADAKGRAAHTLLRFEPPFEPASPLDHVLATRQSLVIEEAQLAGPSGVRTISDIATTVEDDGELLGAVMVFRDVTEQRLLEKRVELSERLASLGAISASIAHEVNNPLTVVTSASALALDDLEQLSKQFSNEPTVLGRIQSLIGMQTDIVEAAARIVRIVRDLRTLSPSDRPQSEVTEVFSAIDWAVKATSQQFERRATVVIRRGIAEGFVTLERTRLEQVIINLLINAAHAIPLGRPDENRVVLDVSRAGGCIVIAIRDTGSGMSPDVVRHVFDPFFTTKDVGTGLGLGLAICHGLVTTAGGQLEVESTIGSGSEFRITLPEPKPAVSGPSPGVGPAPVVQATPRARLLVVDDEEPLLRVFARMLPEHEVVCLTDASEALSLLERDPMFDIIFTDLMMPKLGGMKFYELLLARSPEIARRLVFMTGGILSSQSDIFLRVVGNPCLTKPFTRADLQSIVSGRLLARRPGSGAH